MEAMWSSETTVNFHRTTQRYVPEDGTLHNHRCEELKSRKDIGNIFVLRVAFYDGCVIHIHLRIHRRFKRIQIFMVSMGQKYQHFI
jgi:hypothetical protein